MRCIMCVWENYEETQCITLAVTVAIMFAAAFMKFRTLPIKY